MHLQELRQKTHSPADNVDRLEKESGLFLMIIQIALEMIGKPISLHICTRSGYCMLSVPDVKSQEHQSELAHALLHCSPPGVR